MKTEELETPRKSPRISQSVGNEVPLPAKLVMPEIDWDKICEGLKKKEQKEFFMVMYGGKPVKIYVIPSGSNSEGPVDQSSAKENSDKSAESPEVKKSVKKERMK